MRVYPQWPIRSRQRPSELLSTRHQSLDQHLRTLSSDQIAITVISVEELVWGRLAQIRKATRPQERINAYHWFARALEFLHDFTVLGYDAQAETHFQFLFAQKIRIGTQDLKIAAISLSQGTTLITRNRRDFEQVTGFNHRRLVEDA